jgi:hypothetical protein
MLDEYVSARTKSRFRCHCGNEWVAMPYNVTQTTGCPKCAGNTKLTKTTINDRLSEGNTDIRMIGEYVNSKTNTIFTHLICGSEWSTRPGKVLYDGTGCPRCNRDRPTPREVADELLSKKNITITGEYLDLSTRTEMECQYGHRWVTSPLSVIKLTGCPACAEHGFNTDKEAHGYILDFGDYIKFGISNNLASRLVSHRRNGVYKVIITKLFKDGNDALKWERSVKTLFGGKYVTKERCPDGYTETLSPTLLNELKNTLV